MQQRRLLQLPQWYLQELVLLVEVLHTVGALLLVLQELHSDSIKHRERHFMVMFLLSVLLGVVLVVVAPVVGMVVVVVGLEGLEVLVG
jgi:hypothetical protein